MSTCDMRIGMRRPAWQGAVAAIAPLAFCFSTHALAQQFYRLTILDPAPGWDAWAGGINNAGQVAVGLSEQITFGRDTLALQGFVWDGTRLTGLGEGLPVAINNLGQLAGFTWESTPSSGPISHATRWDGSGLTRLDEAGARDSLAFAINDAGQIVGRAGGPSGTYAVQWQGDTLIPLQSPVGTTSQAVSLNNQGQIVGRYDSPSASYPVLWEGPGVMPMTLTGDRFGWANDINDRGQIVGTTSATPDGRGHATFWDGSRSIDLGTLSGDSSVAVAINGLGQTVGSFSASGVAGSSAVLWNGSVGTDLNSLLRPETAAAGWVLTWANDINDSGSIVGVAYNRSQCTPPNDCGRFAFVLSLSDLPDQVVSVAAIPEPSTYALMLAGLGAIGLWAQRRRAASASR
jgi:probable HAF family extracellular repeat protein